MKHWRWIHTAASASVIVLVFTALALESSYAPMHFVHTCENIGFCLDSGSLVISRYDHSPAVLAFEGHQLLEIPIIAPAAICAVPWLFWGLRRLGVWRPHFTVAAAGSFLIGFGTLLTWSANDRSGLPNAYQLSRVAPPTASPMSLNLGLASYSIWASGKGPPRVEEIEVSYWAVVLVSSIGPWLWFRSFHRHRKRNWTACHVCEYNLTANCSGVCPECGTQIASAPACERDAHAVRCG